MGEPRRFESALAEPRAQTAAAELLEDERRFIDLERSPLWIAREHPVLGGCRSSCWNVRFRIETASQPLARKILGKLSARGLQVPRA